MAQMTFRALDWPPGIILPGWGALVPDRLTDPVWDVVYVQDKDHALEAFLEGTGGSSPTYVEDFVPQTPTYVEPGA
jgi:hypothetical protein